jgi:opacity protein-like surface antigen
VSALAQGRAVILASWLVVALAAAWGAAPASAQTDSGFYLRGMVGAAAAPETTFTDVNPAAANAFFAGVGGVTGSDGRAALFGVGAGYKFTPMLWTDVVASAMPRLHFDGTNNTPALTLLDMSTAIEAETLMFNGYLDIEQLLKIPAGRLQPYVMVGVGYAHTHLATMQGAAPRTIIPTFSLSGHDDNNFSWGTGAGLAIPVGASATVDLAYEYMDLGEVRTGTLLSAPGGSTQVGAIKEELQIHTLQASIRFAF